MKRLKQWIPAIVCASAFGPYLLASIGVRMDHMVVYGLLMITLIYILLRGRVSRGDQPFLFMALIWVMLGGWSLAASFGGASRSALRDLAAGLDAFLIPASVLVVVAGLLGSRARVDSEVFDRAAGATVLFACVGAVLAGVGLVWDIRPLIDLFEPGFVEGETVGRRAAALGRYTSIFGAPSQAGLCYSLALLMTIYLFERGRVGAVVGGVAATIIAMGGVLSVSKAFLIGGVVSAVAFMAFRMMRRRSLGHVLRICGVGAVVTGTAVIGAVVIANEWGGVSYLMRLVEVPGSMEEMVGLYTGGRYTGSGHLQNFAIVADNALVSGFGLAPHQFQALDSLWLEIFAKAGIVGVSLLVIVFITMYWMVVSARKGDLITHTVTILIIFGTVAGFGTPTLTRDRFAPAFWAIVATGMLVVQRRHAES